MAVVSENEGNKKIRKFLPNWFKTYGWLKYDEEKNFNVQIFVYYDVCTKFNGKNFLTVT